MPDQWGRITHNDWNAMTGMINNIQAMGQRNQQYKQNQEDRAEQKEYKEAVNQNVAALSGPQPQARPYEVDGKYVSPDKLQQEAALTGPPTAQIAARSLVAQDSQSKEAIRKAKQSEKYGKIINDLASWRQQNPGMSWDRAPKDLYAGADGQRAYADLINQEAQTEQGKTTIMKNRLARFGEQFKQFDANKNLIQQAMQNGQIDTAVNGLQKMSEELPLPYKLGDYDQETQSFDVQYLDSTTGKFQNSGKMTLQEAAQQMNATGEKEFVTQLAVNAEAVRQGNLEHRKNPLYGKSTSGSRFLIIPQKNVMDPNQVDIEVRNEKTNEKIMFPSWEALQDAGITVENLDREKDLKDLSLKDQQIANAKASRTGGGGSGSKVDYTHLKQVITEGAKFFGQDGGDLFDAQGNLTVAGENTRMEALDFFNQHKGNPSALTETEAQKFQIARAITSATEQYFGFGQQQAMGGQQQAAQTTEQTPYTGSQPPPNAPGAKKDKKGLWYVQKNGKWEVVLKDGQQQEGKQPAAMGGNDNYGDRPDGTPKGNGWLGPIQDDHGNVMTEVSIGVNIDGKETLVPLLVPGLTDQELAAIKKGGQPPQSAVEKAAEHAKQRIAQGKSPFADEAEASTGEQTAENPAAPTEQPQPIGEIDGKAVARTDKGYMVLDGEQWRPPTPEEQGQIEMMARKGQLGATKGWQYETKFPGAGQKQWAINPGQPPQLPNISGRR